MIEPNASPSSDSSPRKRTPRSWQPSARSPCSYGGSERARKRSARSPNVAADPQTSAATRELLWVDGHSLLVAHSLTHLLITSSGASFGGCCTLSRLSSPKPSGPSSLRPCLLRCSLRRPSTDE